MPATSRARMLQSVLISYVANPVRGGDATVNTAIGSLILVTFGGTNLRHQTATNRDLEFRDELGQ